MSFFASAARAVTPFVSTPTSLASVATSTATLAASMFGLINSKPTEETKDEFNKKINSGIDQDKQKIKPKDIEKAEKAEDGSSLTENEDNAILEVEKYKKQLLEQELRLLEQELRQAFIADQQNITKFREECVEEAIKQFQEALSAYEIPITDKISGAIMKKIAESWSEFLISPTQGDSSVYLSYKTFFFRVNQAIDALLTQCIFLSTKWAQTFSPPPGSPPPPPGSPPGSPPPPPPFPPADNSYPRVKVGPCRYAIGPILDFKNIEGRIFIYVKCYRTEQCTDGIYFWVYGSQSEGFNRVFFKLDPFGAIEKGFDYTQGTFVHLRLQMALCSYYKNNITNTLSLIDTLSGLNLFMSLMPYLQQDSRTNGYHLYKIDDMFASIIKRGFPLHSPLISPNTMNNDWSSIINMSCTKRGLTVNRDNQLVIATELNPQWEVQRALFPENDKQTTHPFYDFSRIQMGYGTTCPYIFCFTTCGLKQSCPMFKLFLSANSYKTTFWCQGFQNYTKMLSVDPNHEILSPVLYVVMGALLQEPDMKLSTLRNIILNIGIMIDARIMSQVYNSATKALMTVGSGKFGETDASTRMPGAPPSRLATYQALKSIQAQLTNYESLGLQFTPGKHRMIKNDASLDAIIKENVDKKIDMIRHLAFFFKKSNDDHDITQFVTEVNRLLKFDPRYNTTLLDKIDALKKKIDEISKPSNNTESIETAKNFIIASPEAAAATLFGYISNTSRFETDLTDYAHLCLKKVWIGKMMDDAYRAVQGVFNREGAIHNYLGEDGVFHEFVPDAPPAPPAPPAPYVFISSFDEVRKEDTSPTNPNPTELDVTVVTFAHIYRVDCGYHEVSADGSVLKSMSILYQISTTIVYTREVNPRILYAITQRTPLACLPDLPDAIKYLIAKKIKALITGLKLTKTAAYIQQLLSDFTTNIEIFKLKIDSLTDTENRNIIQQLLEQLIQLLQQEAAAAAAAAAELLTSPYTLLATYGRVTSYGALFAGKMMEYFFGGENGYYQLPYFFRNFDKFLKVCHQYDSTVLMYLPDVSPYDLLDSLEGAKQLLDERIQKYFTDLHIILHIGSIDIQAKINQITAHIQVISDYLTGDFMVDPDILDDVIEVSESQGTTSSGSSTSSGSLSSSGSSTPSTSSRFSGIVDVLLFDDLSSQDTSPTFNSSQELGSRSSQEDMDGSKGGTLPIKNHIKKSITTRKNKSRTKSITPIRRVTIRIKRLMKSKGSKVTKPRTYKRRATGGKRKSKPNKTMRRYRRVRK